MTPNSPQRQSPLHEALAAIYDDPVLFVERFLGVTPEPWQSEFLQAVRDNDRIAVRSAKGVGKTAAASWAILWFLLTRIPVKIAVTAPSFGQMDAGIWAELQTWHRRLPKQLKDLLTVTRNRVDMVGAEGEAFVIARTASKESPEALQGIHSEHMMFVIDEASGVDEEVFVAARGAMSSVGAKVLMLSNPTRVTGYFYDAFNRVADMWKRIHVTAFDSKYSKDGALIEEVRAKDGEDSNAWRIEIMGEFPLADDDTVMQRNLVEDAVTRDVEPTEGPVIWGLDIARHGGDRCALAKRRGNFLLEPVFAWISNDLMQTAMRVAEFYENTHKDDRPAEIYVDVIGMGAGVADRLKELGLPIVGVNVSESPSSKHRYMRLRDELWFRARDWFQARDCKLPRDDLLVGELVAPRYRFEPSGKIKVESKQELKNRGHRSPDLADSFVLTMMNDAKSNYIRKKFFSEEYEYDDAWIV